MQSLIPYFFLSFLFVFCFWRVSRRGVVTAHHGNCRCGQGMAGLSSGCHPLAGGQKDTNPVPRASLDPAVPHSGTAGSQAPWQGYPWGSDPPVPPWRNPCLGAPPKQIIKGSGAAFLERSGSNWRAAVGCGQAFPLLFYSCLMFWKIFRKMTLTVLCQTWWGWKKMKFGRDVIHSACSLDDVQWLTQEF